MEHRRSVFGYVRVKRCVFVVILLSCLLFVVFQLAYVGREDISMGSGGKRDWSDRSRIARESLRQGVGEAGKPVIMKHVNDREHNVFLEGLRDTGFNEWLSDLIPLDRSLPDVRHKNCSSMTYYENLPAVSIVIVYRNEKRSVMLRTLHSVVNRSPRELLHEIILVDDNSADEPHLDGILGELFPTTTIRILHLAAQVGLIQARVHGARAASAEVLVFLDAHVEATHNWLPPLLEPLVDDPRTSTTPIIDTINYETFAYMPGGPSRGGFDWGFNYVQTPLKAADYAHPADNHMNPVMNGGLFAIRASFFWHLGGYDPGLQIWGAEQFELSFKIWMCGGRLLEVPCSRVGHLYLHASHPKHYTNRTDDFVSQNYVRVAEVWMDEYKEVLYQHVPKLRKIAPGDLEAQHMLRQRLHCKPFKWFMDTIIGDMCEVFPPTNPPDFAHGAIQSVAAPHLCLDVGAFKAPHEIGALKNCSSDLQNPQYPQNWRLTFQRDLRSHTGSCLELQTRNGSTSLWLWDCHLQGGNQYWYYDRQARLLVNGKGDPVNHQCLEAVPESEQAVARPCDVSNERMKWSFANIDHKAMDEFHMTLRDRSFCSYPLQ